MPQFLILATDFTDDEALQRRMSVRQDHLQRMRVEKLGGKFIIGGAKLDEEGRMIGSMLIVELEDKEAVREWIREDPYITGKVWDVVEIIPFRVAGV
jgi:uncharacterized protein YciI